MRTVQMTLEVELLTRVDEAVAALGTSRSAFTRQALEQALARLQEAALEAKHREGYERQPVVEGEFSDWHDEQVWPD
ncbi:MAG TPA: ribbon-helix-helix domain-containing protein [Thermoanaerobaculia bacterium]|nr:ribbon-helix-helix domain-containing protein [Thermoanaerobaculia bacterium]